MLLKYPIKCPVCGKMLKYTTSGSDMFYAICPTNSKKHIFEIGPYRTEKLLLKKMGEINE